jgi:hypothetical protein
MRKTPAVMGVLSMVFGGIQAAISALTIASQPFSKGMMTDFSKAFSGLPKQEGQPDPAAMFEQLGRVTEGLKVYNYALHGVLMLMSIALIVIGYMLFHRRPASRPLSIGWALAALAYLPVMIYIEVKVILPRTQEVMAQMFAGSGGGSEALMQGMSGMTGTITVVGNLVLHTPFPILLLILIGRPSTKYDLAPG